MFVGHAASPLRQSDFTERSRGKDAGEALMSVLQNCQLYSLARETTSAFGVLETTSLLVSSLLTSHMCSFRRVAAVSEYFRLRTSAYSES